jgi:hypothetical protein
MALQKPITDRIFDFLQISPEGEFDALVIRYPEFTANELYAEVGRLSRTGQVTITRGVGVFTFKLIAKPIAAIK